MIIPAILTPVRNRTRCFKCPRPVAQIFGGGFKALFIEAIGTVGHEGRQHVVARIVEDAVVDRE